MDNIQEISAMTALNHMFKQGHMSIWTIDKIAKLMKIDPKGRAYDVLSTVHCVYFRDMPKELKDSIPDLIRECLSLSTVYEFEHLKKQKVIVGQSPMEKLLNYVKGQ